MYAWLTDALAAGNLVITASRRLTRDLRHAYNTQQISDGKKAWSSADIHYLADWLNGIRDNEMSAGRLPVLLDPQSSLALWQRCVIECFDDNLPGLAGIVRQSRQAWTRLQDWRVSVKELSARATGPDQRQFAAAAKRYDRALADNNWVDDAANLRVVTAIIESGSLNLPGAISLAGFDRVWPSLQRLTGALESAGTVVNRVQPGDCTSNIAVECFDDPQAEARAAGAWARGVLTQFPAARVAIVCPDLESSASSVVRMVREGVVPGWQYAGQSHRDSVNVSYGRPLADFPAVAVALLLLRWAHERLSSREISVLLRSKSVVGGSMSGRSRLEQQLRRLPEQQWQPAALISALRHPESGDDADGWFAALQPIADAQLKYPGRDSPAEWAERFHVVLTEAGWPGSEPQDSSEFQLVNRWRDLLNDLARLERVQPLMNFGVAVSRLISIASDSIFQPEAGPESGILPVLGSLEAAGMEFDKIWVMRMDDSQWPSSSRPLAMVSRQLQKDHDMPDATPQDSLAFSKRVLQRLLRAADDVVLSWAATNEGVEQQASPLLQELDSGDRGGSTDPGWHARLMISSSLVDTVAIDPVPSIGDNEKVAGGAYTVQRQVVDPFSAFAVGRLRANELQSFQPALSAAIRGSAIHAALSELLADRPSQEDIQNWDEKKRINRIRAAAKRALAKHAWYPDDGLRRIVHLEQNRIEHILLRFVEEEAQREDFRIAMVEQSLDYARFGVRLQLRVDRVDRLSNGDLLVIDYKTGIEKALLDRNGDLKDLQLMVYGLAVSGVVGGLALINLDSRKISFRDTGQVDDITASLSAWTKDTEAAIRAIAEGDALVNVSLPSDKARSLNVLSRFEELRRG